MFILQGRSKRGTTSLLYLFCSITGTTGEFYSAFKSFSSPTQPCQRPQCFSDYIITKQIHTVNKKYPSQRREGHSTNRSRKRFGVFTKGLNSKFKKIKIT